MVLVGVCVLLSSLVLSQNRLYAILGSWNPSSDSSFQGPFEPDETEPLDASMPDHPGLVSVACHDQERLCMRSTTYMLLFTDSPLPVFGPPSSHFGGGPVYRTNPNPASSKQQAQFSTDTQRGFSDNPSLGEGSGALRGGSTRNSDGIRLRQVSELRSCSFFFSDRRRGYKSFPSRYLSYNVQVRSFQCHAIKLFRHGKKVFWCPFN
jgi:hypothetical protein